MVFSLFKKSRKSDGTGSLIDAVSMPGDDSAPSTVPRRGVESMDQVRKRQAEMSAKIDQIEQEMRGEFPTITRPTMPRKATPVPHGVDVPQSARREPDSSNSRTGNGATSPPTLPPLDMSTGGLLGSTDAMGGIDVSESEQGVSAAVEEAAVLYANGQNAECIKALKDALAASPTDREAWLLLFEVYQQTGTNREFEALAMDYSVRFESSPPAWRQLQRAAAKTSLRAPEPPLTALPRLLDAEVIKEVEQFKRHSKSERVRLSFDAVREVDEHGAALVVELLRGISKSQQQVVVSGIEVTLACLRNVLVVGEKTHPESAWLLAMELLRVLGRQKDYDDLSADYTITFEVSPPQYEPPGPNIIGAQPSADAPEVAGAAGPAELVGHVTGRATEAMAQMDAALIDAGDHVQIDCSQLARVDFAGAGSLLNWLMSGQARGRRCTFTNVNPLVAALFSVMGISGVAEVVRRKN